MGSVATSLDSFRKKIVDNAAGLSARNGGAMDSGLAAVIGAIVGGVATLGGTVLNDCLRVWRESKDDEPRKELLKNMLQGGHEWRKLETLSNVVGLNLADTKRLLIAIGARGSETNGNLWGLVSRNPIPTHDE